MSIPQNETIKKNFLGHTASTKFSNGSLLSAIHNQILLSKTSASLLIFKSNFMSGYGVRRNGNLPERQ